MFSKEYFDYLIRSKKYLLLFLLLLMLLIIVGGRDMGTALGIEGLIGLMLCFALPVYIFYYVHDKKAVDTFFSIPVSRKALLVTGIIFCIMTVYLPVATAMCFYAVAKKIGVLIIAYLFEILLAVTALIIFNTTLYLIANNIIDGIIMIGAYSFMPLAVFMVLNSMVSSYVAGFSSWNFEFLYYLSPAAMAANIFVSIFDKEQAFVHVLGLLAVALIFGCILMKAYTNRNVERAGTPSDRLLAYPFVIYFYVTMCLFFISSGNGYGFESLSAFLRENFIIYVMLFAVFMGAYFIYKRKFFFPVKLPVVFAAAVILSLLITGLCKSCHGFGLAQMYERNDPYQQINIIVWYEDEDTDVQKYIYEKTGEKASYYNVCIYNDRPEDDKWNMKLSASTMDIIEELRQRGISDFYEKQKGENYWMQLNITNSAYGSFNRYLYQIKGQLDMKTILELAKDEALKVTIDTDMGGYILNKDGILERYY
ncbi:MAG: hypothetical protein IKE38_06030 [Erysipelotrichaceae bacterium]|nr:hypothetical protein [Erysipelotrichaceae bacterium]